MVLDGKEMAGQVLSRLREQPKPDKFFAVVLAGENPASISFIEQKKKTAEALGVDFRWYRFAETISQDDLREEVGKIAAHKSCGGVVVQLPLPADLDRHYVLNAMPREKDVDALGERAIGAFYTGRNAVLPPAVGTVEEILKQTKFRLEDAVVAVVGLGLVIGKPLANWLMEKTKGLHLLAKGSDFSMLEKADLVIVGVGKAGLVTPAMLKDGAGVIDFGYSMNGEGKLSGDFDTTDKRALEKLSFYTPTPGGTGPILVAKLFENFYALASGQKK